MKITRLTLACGVLASALAATGATGLTSERISVGKAEPPASLAGRLSDRKISLTLKNAHLPDVAAALSRETGMPVLADACTAEVHVPTLDSEEVPLSVAVQQTPRLHGREVLLAGGVLVLRDPRWPERSGEHNPLYP